MRLHYEIKGMSCAACVGHVERAIKSVTSESDEISVSLLTNSVTVVTSDDNDEAAMCESMAAAVARAGYTLVTEGTKKGAENKEAGKRINVLIVSAVFTVAVMILAMGHMIDIPLPSFLTGAENALRMAIAQAVLTIPVLVLNRKFFVSGMRALLHRSPNMDSLIAVGSGAAFAYGTFAIVMMATAKDVSVVHQYLNDLYFESAAMILTLVSFGKLLESRAKDKASDAVYALAKMAPKFASVIRDGAEKTIPVEQICTGDEVIIRTGEWIPVDGTVIRGSGSTDESAITGESMPIEKEVGSSVCAASVLTNGSITIRAEQVGEDTSLSRIIRLLEDAASSKAPIARVADRVSAVFVPCVMIISLITFATWMIATQHAEQALRSAIAVLVISCPCALGLATPTAITVGIGRGAKCGVLFRSAESLEKLCAVQTVVFDKTGTLTEGKPAVTDVYAYGTDLKRVLKAAASVESLSSHPLARAVGAANELLAGESLFEVTDFQNLTGVGACGVVDGVRCKIGKPDASLLQSYSDPTDDVKDSETVLGMTLCRRESTACFAADFRALEKDGKTVAAITFDGVPVGILAFADRLRPDSVAAAEVLKNASVRCLMLTGDNEQTASFIASQAKLDGFYAGLLPEDKERIVGELSQSGGCAMVGDGINDAPALLRADVGVAVGAGTEVAIDCADVVLAGSSLVGVCDALLLSRATVRIIKQNLFWALFYNVICIPIAAGVFYPLLGWQLSPMLASAAMSFSSVCVVTNALRLRSVPLSHKKGKAEENEKTREKGEKKMFGKKEIVTYTLSVEGMMCQHCVAHVKKALEDVKGVVGVSVDLDAKSAVVQADSRVSKDTLTKAVTSAGYTCE